MRARTSLYDEGPSSLLMEIVEEFVLARCKRPDIDDSLGPWGNDFLDPERYALEFHGGCVQILDPYDNRPVGGCVDFSGLKVVAFNRNVDRGGL
jgi:hypothetical protein